MRLTPGRVWYGGQRVNLRGEIFIVATVAYDKYVFLVRTEEEYESYVNGQCTHKLFSVNGCMLSPVVEKEQKCTQDSVKTK